jgi:glutamate carboxypeptidase
MSHHTTGTDDRILSHIAPLVEWAQQESPTGAIEAINGMASLVQHAIGSTALGSERIALAGFGDMLIIRGGPQNGKSHALMLGHLDTVHAIGTAQTNLRIRREGSRLFGPGLYDMKAGIWIALNALLSLAKAGNLVRPVIFALAPDEEVGSPASRAITEGLARGAAFALVLEPAREGRGCVTCRKGVGRFEVAIEGVAAHAGVRHDAGHSAVTEAAHQVLKVEALTDYAQGVTTNVGLITGGTSVNTVPQHCKFTVDFRAPTEPLCNALVHAIGGLVPMTPGTKVAVRGGVARPPYERSEANVALYRKAQAIADALDLPFREAPRTGGGSDGNFTTIHAPPNSQTSVRQAASPHLGRALQFRHPTSQSLSDDGCAGSDRRLRQTQRQHTAAGSLRADRDKPPRRHDNPLPGLDSETGLRAIYRALQCASLHRLAHLGGEQPVHLISGHSRRTSVG